MQYKFNSANISAEVFTIITAIINFIAMVHIFETTYYRIFKYLLAASSKNKRFLGSISTYLNIMEINSQ